MLLPLQIWTPEFLLENNFSTSMFGALKAVNKFGNHLLVLVLMSRYHSNYSNQEKLR